VGAGQQQGVPAAEVIGMSNGRMLLELWEYREDGKALCLFSYAGPRGDAARSTIPADAELVWTVWAESHYEAMTLYYERQDWGPYTTDQPWDLQPYPESWVEEQRAYLATTANSETQL
jgi:hypothetical protein